MPTLTPNYSLSKPLVNDPTDQDLWGGELNSNMDTIDSELKIAVDTVHNSITSSYTLLISDRKKILLCDATSGAITISLLAAATAGDGFTLTVKKTDSSGNSVTLDGSGSETIDGALTYALSSQYGAITLICDGTNWNTITPASPSVSTRQYLTSGSSTYTTPSGAKLIAIRMVGGGGGGGARATNAGSVGSNTIFNSINAAGGGGGSQGGVNTTNAAGGTGGSGTALLRIQGGSGFGAIGAGGGGGSSVFGGGAGGPTLTLAGPSGSTNSGGGGAGGGAASTTSAGAYGGGAGEYVEFRIATPSSTYSYTVGAGGGGGSAGGLAGGNGGSGLIIVDEYY